MQRGAGRGHCQRRKRKAPKKPKKIAPKAPAKEKELPIKLSIGALYYLMDREGMSMRELSASIGMSQSCIHVANNRGLISSRVRESVIKTFGVDLSDMEHYQRFADDGKSFALNRTALADLRRITGQSNFQLSESVGYSHKFLGNCTTRDSITGSARRKFLDKYGIDLGLD